MQNERIYELGTKLWGFASTWKKQLDASVSRDEIEEIALPALFGEHLSELSKRFNEERSPAHDCHEAPPLEELIPLNESGRLSFEQYEILGVEAFNKNSRVFKARDPRLSRLVSLKICDGGISGQDKDAILSEGRALARINSPYVVRCYSVENFDGTLVLVNEWVEGQTLEQLMTDNALSYRQVFTLFWKISSGVGAIHSEGLLHCDLKPSNIIVDAGMEPRIIDFGLAQDSSDLNSSPSGTLSWVAPEVINSDLESIGPPTDIFGLGGVLYFMLTGQAPYTGESKNRLLSKARACKIQPSHKVAGTYANKLDRICMRCLSPDTNERYQSIEQLAGDLRNGFLKKAMIPFCFAILLLAVLPTLFRENANRPFRTTEPASHSTERVKVQLPQLVKRTRWPKPNERTYDRSNGDRESLPRPKIWLKFEQFCDGGYVKNQVNSGFEGMLYYDVILNSSGVDGRCLALNFLGIDKETACVAIDEGLPELPLEQRTISLWFNAERVTGDKQVLYEEGSDDRGINIYLDSGRLYVGRWNFREQTFLKTTVIAESWNHVCLVLDSRDGALNEDGQQGRLYGYLNGQQFGIGVAASINPYNGHLCIGRQDTNLTRFHDVVAEPNNQFAFVGRIDEFRIFEQPLLSHQVKQLFDEIEVNESGVEE